MDTFLYLNELKKISERINLLPYLPEEIKEKIEFDLERLSHLGEGETFFKELDLVKRFLKWTLELPWGKFSLDNTNIESAKDILDKGHYGLEPVKTRILEFLAITLLKKERRVKIEGYADKTSPILCFVGIQGVGKTTMAKSIAKALGRAFYRIPMGGMGNISELRGSSRYNLDSEPGFLIKALISSKTFNPVILLDEIDKSSGNAGIRMDIMSSLLEILDPEQNKEYTDKFLDFSIDLSNVIFITTANNLNGISAALLDRLEVIRFGSYTDEDKINIAKNYLLKKVLLSNGLDESSMEIDDDVWPLVIRPIGFDAGIRELERTLGNLARKLALLSIKEGIKNLKITKENFRNFIPEQIGFN